jgi:hypothetical protein
VAARDLNSFLGRRQRSKRVRRRPSTWRSRRIITVVLIATALICARAVDVPARATSSAKWSLPFPQTISYHTLSVDRSVQCGRSDATFSQQVHAEGLDTYEIYLVDGTRGSCGRRKAEQMKHLSPAKMVLEYESPAAEDPRAWPGGTWAGYYLLMNRTTALASLDSLQTDIPVADPTLFSVGDTAVMWAPTPSDPYANSEWITVTAINGAVLTVTRDFFGTGALTFDSPPLIAAAVTGSGYPLPNVNLSSIAPVNPATGQRANQWLAANMIADFTPSTTSAPTLDGMELDAAASRVMGTNKNGAIKNADCDGDGLIDYCQTNVGTNQQVDAYAIGYDDFLHMLQQGLASYDTDPRRPPKMLLADGDLGLRSIEIQGAEFESYPSWDNYTYSSAALQQLGTWHDEAGTPGNRLSYAFTKDATPLYPAAGCVTPAQGGSCRNANFRFGMVSSLLFACASSYNDGASYTHAEPWDEEGTVDQSVTGLAPGYLGQPVRNATRLRRFTSDELTLNGSFEQDLTGVTFHTGVLGALAITQDTTTAAPYSGAASLRADVSALSLDPNVAESRVQIAIAPVTPGEYTVEFWAKANNTVAGPAAMNLAVAFPGVTGPPDAALLTPAWRHYVLQFAPTAPVDTAAALKFGVGAEIGQYWIDGVSVHAGTAGIIMREFTNGIVVLNDSFSDQANVPLPDGPYHHIAGVQDTSANDGTSVGSMLPVIPAKDGVILLRG